MSPELTARDDFECRLIQRIVERNEYCLKDDLSGAIVLDVGAHIGAFSAACLIRGAEKSYCYEPDPEAATICSENLSKIGDAWVTSAAVWGGDVPDELALARYATDDSRTGSAVYCLDPIVPSWRAPAVDFDEVVEAINHEHGTPIAIVKLNCEGAEYPILYNSSVLDVIKNIVIEYHEIDLPLRDEFAGTVDPARMTGEDLAQFLNAAGFHVVGSANVDSGTIWASRSPEDSPFTCFDDAVEGERKTISVNLVAGSGAYQGPGGWIFSRMAKEIVERANRRGDVEVTMTATPDASRPYDVYHYLHSTLAVQNQYMLHRSIVTVHAMDSEAVERSFHHKAETLGKARMVTCVSNSILNELVERGMDASKLRFTPQGVDLDVFRPAETDVSHPEVRIGIVGRRYSDGKKGERFLCDVMNSVALAIPSGVEVTFSFVGPDWDTGPVADLKESVYVPTNIHIEFLGMMDEAAVADEYRRMDGCIVTSRCPECGPMCILEALATGIPVVATPGGNALHFLGRSDGLGHLGRVVAYGDVPGFTEAIMHHIVDPVDHNRTAVVRTRRSLTVRESPETISPWSYANGKIEIDPDAPYSWQRWADRFADLYVEIASDLSGQVFVSDYISDADQATFRQSYRSGANDHLGPLYVRNFMQVMPYARSGLGLLEMTNKLHGVPTVIVGMGPSLDGCIDLLREHQDEIAIVTCDAALRKLLAADIVPTMVVVADPSDRQIENFSGVDGTQFVTALPTIVHPLVFHATRRSDCTIVWYNVADGNQEICQHIPRIVGNKGAIQPAVLTTGMAYIAALHMGCSPVTFIGSDLCWYDLDKGYASGVSPTKAQWQRRNKMFGNAVMLFPDIVGRPVVTEPCFVAFWQWLNDYLQNNDLTVYNSSGCGILHGERIVQVPFDRWIEDSLARSSGGRGHRRTLLDAYAFARQQVDVFMCHQLSPEEVRKLAEWAEEDA